MIKINDNSRISEVSLYGKCEQNGTPTPDNPVDIVCNNGVLKARHQSGLPLGYTLLEYIESTETQAIKTDLTGFGTGNWEIYIKFMSTSKTQVSYASIVSVYKDEEINTYRVIFDKTDGQRFLLSGNSKAGGGNKTVDGAINEIYEATLKNGSVVFDGVTYETPIKGTALPNDVLLTMFGSTTGRSCSKARIYSVKATKDGVLRANYIPARRNSDNVLGMYDLVSGQFFTNQGTDDFTAGDPVSDPVEIYTDGTIETVQDSLGNTATAEMLLKVGDYQDV